jgi:T5orf172 domain
VSEVIYESDFDKVMELLRQGVDVRHPCTRPEVQEARRRERLEENQRRHRRNRLEKIKAKARAVALEKRRTQRLYVFAVGPFVKIGIAGDVEDRWRSIRGHNPLLERPLYIGVVLGTAAREFEREAHQRLHAYRRQGEWFLCSRWLAIETVKQITGDDYG